MPSDPEYRSTTATADVRDLARKTIIETLGSWLYIIDESGADAILAALAVKGIGLCGPGKI